MEEWDLEWVLEEDVHQENNNVLVVATANNYKKLPDSLKRNGRFDKKIELATPSYEDARKIIEYYMKNKPVDPNLNYEDEINIDGSFTLKIEKVDYSKSFFYNEVLEVKNVTFFQ